VFVRLRLSALMLGALVGAIALLAALAGRGCCAANRGGDRVGAEPEPGDAATDGAAPDGASSGSTATASSTAAATASSAVPTASEAPKPVIPTASPEELAAWQQCAIERQRLLDQPSLEGAPSYEQNRLLMARVRGRTLLWRRAPTSDSRALEKRVAKGEKTLRAVRGVLRSHRRARVRRKILLREGYLWSDQPELALALVEQVGLTHLFREKTLHLERGADRYILERVGRTRYLPERYLYQDGALAGETAEILHGDRVAAHAEDLAGPLHIDLDDAQQQGKFDRLRPVHLTEQALVAELRYGPETWVPAVLGLDGARARVHCEVLTAELAAKKKAFVVDDGLRRRAMARLREVVLDMVREQIPFDADRNQENGFMRRGWKRAYFNGWKRFTLRDKKYDVYSPEGQPIPPQVCIDFIIDTWERAAGRWYQPLAGSPPKPQPGMTEGPIDFAQLGLRNRRSVADFVELTKAHPELFEVWDIPKEEWIRFEDRERFFRHLAERADQIREGDMLIIKGYKEGGRPHYHSLVVLETDPVSGVPVRVAGNAVVPRAQTLEGVMHISPKRSIRHRIRLRKPLLGHVAAKAPPDAP